MATRLQDPDRGVTLGSLVLPVYIPALLLSAGSGAMSTFLPLFLRDLGAGVSTVAVLVGIGSAGVLVFDLPSGFLVARYGERRTLAASGVVMVAGAALLASSRSLAAATVGVFFTYAAASFWFLGRLSFMRSALPTERRGRGLATLGGLMRVGLLCGPMAGGYVAEAAGYRWVFYGTAGLAAASMLLFLASERRVARASGPAAAGAAGAPGGTAERAPGLPAAPAGALFDSRTLLRVLRGRKGAFLTAGVSMLLLGIVRSGRGLVFPLWGQQMGLEASRIGVAAGLASAADTLMFLPAGAVSDRLGRKWSAIGCFLVLSAGMAAVPLARDYPAFLLVGMLAGLGNGLGSGINMTIGADLAEGSDTAVFLGLWRLVTDIGVAGAPLLIGVVTVVLALGPASVAIAGIGFAGAAFHARFVKETLERKRSVRHERKHGPPAGGHRRATQGAPRAGT